ncbi:MAG: thioredoxin domain-containing protein [Bacteroidota bacterium]
MKRFHNKVQIGCVGLLLLSLISCQGQPHNHENSHKNHAFTNALITESSPYLLQHAHNPVNWRPWQQDAFKQAQQEGKLVIISVGYSACHWCHVMEHESFEDTAVARRMNTHFVSIKVDREERPDVDDIYMNACHLMNQRGCGWPLNAIALPDGRPIFAGTYFPKDQWLNILQQVHGVYKNDPSRAARIADQVAQGIRSIEEISLNETEATFTAKQAATAYRNFIVQLDMKKGGGKGAPKFPMPQNYKYLLRYHHLYKDEKALKGVTSILNNMAFGGIYDHLGGGFARYSTDADWLVPHFEKMLYDNAQLVSLYAEAFRLTQNPLYKQVIEETLEFVGRELTDENGGFYSSLDADSEGEEGKYYVWTAAEITEALGEKAAALFIPYYEIRERGNWEASKNIIHRRATDKEVADKLGVSVEKLRNSIEKSKSILHKIQWEREHPGLDDKIITAWNALMLRGYVDAYRALEDEAYLEAATKNAQFILENCMSEDSRLSRIHKDGRSTINAFLDDYALTAQAFISLYQVTFEEKWLFQAQKLAEYARKHFFEAKTGMFYYTSDQDAPLIARKTPTSDNVIPGANSTMARVLSDLGLYFYQDDYQQMARQMLHNVMDEVSQKPAFYTNWATLHLDMISTPYEVAITGKDWEKKRKELDAYFLPNIRLLGGKSEGKLELLTNKLIKGQTTIYVCQNKICKLPATEVSKALKLMLPSVP